MIQRLPPHIANQIAAGEVVQRPASALKELLENAVDAHATAITIIATDAGRTLLQVIDNGCGMTAADARMAFERHATSKINTVDDLNAIATFGFRGEALASVAAVSEVTLKTQRAEDETGTELQLSASEIIRQEAVAGAVGTSIAVRNLFFNIPARRKFLKSDAVELKHIITEMQRVALCRPEVALRLLHNGTELYNLPVSNGRQRIVNLMGKDMNQQLIDLQIDTSVVRIKGFIGKPGCARRTMGDQYFFVNNRFFKSAYFQKAVFNAYQQLLPDKTFPAFFIYFELPPDKIDVNIHPAKIEIKFEDEQVIFQMLHAVVREALGKFAIVPSIDFDTEGAPPIPVLRRGSGQSTPPQVRIDPFFNPFLEEQKTAAAPASFSPYTPETGVLNDVELPYGNMPQRAKPDNLPLPAITGGTLFRFKGKYILMPVKSGLMIIDIRRAQRRILYERFLENLSHPLQETQPEIFPQTVTLAPADYALLESVLPELAQAGYDIHLSGNGTVTVNGQPAAAPRMDAEQLLEQLLHLLHEETLDLKTQRQEKLAQLFAKAAVGRTTDPLHPLEMQPLVDTLFACKEPALSPEGKPALQILTNEEIDKRFLR